MGNKRHIWKWTAYGAVLFLALILQGAVCPFITAGGAHPNLTVTLVIVVALFEGALSGSLCGALIGLFTGLLLFPGGVFYMIVFFALGFVSGRFLAVYFKKSLSTALLWSLGSLFCVELLYYLCFFMLTGKGGLVSFAPVVFGELIVTLPFIPLLYAPVRLAYRKWGKNLE